MRVGHCIEKCISSEKKFYCHRFRQWYYLSWYCIAVSSDLSVIMTVLLTSFLTTLCISFPSSWFSFSMIVMANELSVLKLSVSKSSYFQPKQLFKRCCMLLGKWRFIKEKIFHTVSSNSPQTLFENVV